MIIRLIHPLISCICITAYRPAFLVRAVICFDLQKYPNRELVISYPEDDNATREVVNKIVQDSDLNIIVIERSNHLSLGLARNQAVAKSNGDYICTWDDDDYYSERRVADQFNAMLTLKQKREACILTNVLLFDRVKDIAHLSGSYNWGGSLLCRKEIILQYPYLDDDIAEDRLLIKYLESSKYLHHIPDRGELYTFIYHGNNMVNEYEYFYFLQNGILLTEDSKEWLKNYIDKKVEILSS